MDNDKFNKLFALEKESLNGWTAEALDVRIQELKDSAFEAKARLMAAEYEKQERQHGTVSKAGAS